MPGPYDQSKYKLLQSMIKKSEDPLPDWSDYPVEIRGRAANFKEAEERLNILKTKPYAFSTDNDESVKLKLLKEKKSLTKIKTTTSTSDDLKNKLKSFHLEFNDSGEKNFGSPSSSRHKGKKIKTNNKNKENSKFTKKSKKLRTDDESHSSKLSYTNSSHESSDSSAISLLEDKRRKKTLPNNNPKKLKLDSPFTSNSKKSRIDDQSGNGELLRTSSSHESSDSSPINNLLQDRKQTKISPKNNSKNLKLDDTKSSSCDGDNFFNVSNSKKPLEQQNPTRPSMEINTRISEKPIKIDKDSSQSGVIKYFTSISKQIGQVNSSLVKNSALLDKLTDDVTEIKKIIKQKCFCGGGGNVGEDGSNNECEETRAAGGEKLKTIDIPMESKEIFANFNELLNTDITFRNQVVYRMHQLVNKGDSLNKNMTAVIKSYISRDLAVMYVPSKQGKGENSKLVFKDTSFYQCIQEVMRKKMKNTSGGDLSDKDILTSMSATIRNARDWDGFRFLRTQKIEKPAKNIEPT
ncbi:uncharacterized protein LOC123305268 isoform X2 [Chrysoperla carnea]|nr:uncharacterized protein LOC123305268 isoform X2 [Chrysoperla carnea]